MFIHEACKNNLSLDEFLLLMYFDNSYDPKFDLNLIKEVLNIKEDLILEAYSGLLKKHLIKMLAVKNEDGKITEKICLDEFYKNVLEGTKENLEDKKNEDIYSEFIKVLGRPLSEIDRGIINAWLERGFTEELILAALKEAAYNDVLNLRYIDKVLYEWNRKGIKEAKDIKQSYSKENTSDYKFEPSLLDFNWLDEK